MMNKSKKLCNFIKQNIDEARIRRKKNKSKLRIHKLKIQNKFERKNETY